MYHHPPSGLTGGPPPPALPGAGLMMGAQHLVPGQQPQQPQEQQQKHDIFVGNLAFSTTEEQLHQAFSEIGRLVKVRMVNDLETGKPRGFAFIEFEDPQAALSAIRNMNDYELNGRRIRVNFSNSSHLEALAGKLGMDLSSKNSMKNDAKKSGPGGDETAGGSGVSDLKKGTNAIADALLTMSKGEMYDVISQLKQLTEKDPDEARKTLCGHPQLPEAILYLMSKLNMIQTPLESFISAGSATGFPNPGMNLGIPPPKVAPPQPPPQQAFNQPPPSRVFDPRGNLADPRAALSDPRAAARADPRALTRDPRAANPAIPVSGPPPTTAPPTSLPQQQPPPRHKLNIAGPPPSMSMPPPPIGIPPPPYNVNVPPPGRNFTQPPPQQPQQPPPQTTQPPPVPVPPGAGNPPLPPHGQGQPLNSNLVKQVMSLTPQQIAGLPPDKQQSILALRQQITGNRM